MNPDLDFFQVSKLSEDQKKGFHQKRNTFPEYVHLGQIVGGDADEDHTQIFGGYIPHPPPSFITPGCCSFMVFASRLFLLTSKVVSFTEVLWVGIFRQKVCLYTMFRNCLIGGSSNVIFEVTNWVKYISF